MASDNTTKYTFTNAEIAALRDDQLLSWAKVAAELNLGSPGAARRAYSVLVRPHTDSVLPGRTSGAGFSPVDLAGLDLDSIREALVGRTIVVQRRTGTEDIAVTKVTSLKADTINLRDESKARAIKIEAVLGVR